MQLGTRLFVGNLPEHTCERDLQTTFSSFGEIVNLDLKAKLSDECPKKNFAFITLAADNQSIETCIKHFSNNDFKGQRVYVTRARESFLERLQRERENAAKLADIKNGHDHNIPKKNPVIKLSEKLNPRKRNVESNDEIGNGKGTLKAKMLVKHKSEPAPGYIQKDTDQLPQKKLAADKKRIESMRQKRQEFREKQMIIKTGLIGIDKTKNKKVIFAEHEDISNSKLLNDEKPNKSNNKKNILFDNNDDSGDEPNFEIKKQFEGKKGQKVLDLQSRYKFDNRFTLDERFVDNESEDEKEQDKGITDKQLIELRPEEEKAKQLNILQDVLGVTIKSRTTDTMNNTKKAQTKLGMLRFDPAQPQHAKFLAPVENQETKTGKKKKKQKQDEVKPEIREEPKIVVSKEQFYKVSETLKEAIAQPTTFSLRSIFGSDEQESTKDEQNADYKPLEMPKDKKKIKNPLEPREKNPFVYDSSDSETDEKEDTKLTPAPESKEHNIDVKAVWKENLFFSESDYRFKEGLAFFQNTSESEVRKERRELKSVMKKRIYNKERKNQMFQKKIGGKKKNMRKPADRKLKKHVHK